MCGGTVGQAVSDVHNAVNSDTPLQDTLNVAKNVAVGTVVAPLGGLTGETLNAIPGVDLNNAALNKYTFGYAADIGATGDLTENAVTGQQSDPTTTRLAVQGGIKSAAGGALYAGGAALNAGFAPVGESEAVAVTPANALAVYGGAQGIANDNYNAALQAAAGIAGVGYIDPLIGAVVPAPQAPGATRYAPGTTYNPAAPVQGIQGAPGASSDTGIPGTSLLSSIPTNAILVGVGLLAVLIIKRKI